MEVVTNNYIPGDSRLVQQIVYELKSQGIFDQFRKECIADVDTKPAYQNLRQRVEGSVSSFLNEKVWSPDMNKNQVREQLRKSIHESGYLDIGVERIVDQVVNPKINSVFLPQVEDVVYRYLGVQKPVREIKKGLKIDIEDLLPTDLEAVSPESVISDKNDSKMEDTSELDNSLNKQIDDDESPPFEPLDNEPTLVTTLEENSVDSHLSGFSGLQSHDNSNQICQMDISSQDSQTSQNSSESHLSIVTSDETVMELGDDSRSKLIKPKEPELKTSYNIQVSDNELIPDNIQTVDKSQTSNNAQSLEEIQIDSKPSEQLKKIETIKSSSEKKSDKKVHSRKSDEKKLDDKKSTDKKYESKKNDKHTDERKNDEKKSEKRDDKKSKSSDKYTSKDKKDDKYKKSSSKSKDRDKSNSRHNSSSSKEKDSSTKDKDSSLLTKEKEQSSKDKTKIKEKKDYRSSSSTKDRGDKEKVKDKNDKDKSDKDKNKFDKPRSRSEKDKERSDKDKDKYEKKKEKSDRDKNKTSSSSGGKSSSSSSKDRSSSNSRKDKYRSSGSDSKDKLKSDGDSKSSRSDIKSRNGDLKTSSNGESRSKSSDHSKMEEKQSLTSSSSKKSKKRDSKKQTKDDHYSSKDKKSDRRSTDRDSNDGQSNKQSHSNSLSESTSSSSQKQSNESSSISGSGTNDSGNSDRAEHVIMTESHTNNNDVQKLKYVKPKLASNFQEAIKIMKIRKQLAKLERKNQLSLAKIDLINPVPNGIVTDKPIVKSNHTYTSCSDNIDSVNHVEDLEEPDSTNIDASAPIKVTTPLKTTDLSKESWEALEARLAQEMSNVNCSSYESYDDYDYSGCEVIISPKKNVETSIENLIVEETSSNNITKLEDNLEEPLEVEREANEISNIDVAIIEDTVTESSAQMSNTNHNAEELRLESDDIKIPSPYNSEKSNGTHPKVHEIEEIGLVECIIPNQVEDETISSNQLVPDIPEVIENINEYIGPDSMCRYLEKPSPSVQRNLQFIYQFVKKLESDVEHCIKASQNNFLHIQRGKKRKNELYVDLKNNNNTFLEEITEVKKRGRPPGVHSNTSNSKANKDKSRNSTDVSPNERFSLPLSPAESDKSIDKKEDIKPEKQTNQVKTPKPKRQRYSSEDLYKPRPLIGRGRRGRCAKTSD